MPEQGVPPRRVALVVGVEPAAVATVAGVLVALGAGDLVTGPDGSWVGDLHAELLHRCDVETGDARPTAWFETGKLSANGITRARLTEWLGRQFVHPEGERAGQPRPDVVVADPGLAWFLGLWRAAALRCDAEVAHVVVLRPAAEVAGDAGEAAAWLNRTLHLERGTRNTRRTFLPWADVAADWTIPFVALGRDLGLRSVQEATANQIRRGHDAVVAGPPPSAATWSERVPQPVQQLADSVWAALTAEDGPDPDELDGLRAHYLDLYSTAESLTGSSVRAAVRSVTAPAAGSATSPTGSQPAPTVRERARRGARRALGR